MASTNRSAKAVYWQRMVDRFNASGLSVSDFCARYHISTQSLYQWRRKLHSDRSMIGSVVTPPGLLPVRIVPEQPSSEHRSSSFSQVEIVTPSGFIVRVDASVQSSQLAELLRVVEEVCDGGDESC